MNSPRQTIHLRNNNACAELLVGHGGILHRLYLDADHGAVSVIASGHGDTPYGSAHLFPFANRLADGAYHFDGHAYQFPINESERNNALHGFLCRRNPDQVLQNAPDRARLVFTYQGELDYYPFPCQVTVDYRLITAAELEIRITVTNQGNTSCPVGLGWHPYFSLGQPVDELALRLPAASRVEVGQRMLPTGENAPDMRFSALTTIAHTELDDCFELLEPGDTSPVLIWSRQQQLGLAIWQESGDRGRHFVQLYTPPDRRSIAIEPVTCGLDAFNSGKGLRILGPGTAFSTTFGVRLITDPGSTHSLLNKGN